MSSVTRALGARVKVSETQRLLPQRERLIVSIVELVEDGDYAGVSVAALARHAHVSSATFYKLFADKRECFLAGYLSLAAELTERVRRAVEEREAIPAWQSALRALLAFTAERPAGMLLLTEEAMIAGPAVVQARAQLIDAIDRAIDEAAEHRLSVPGRVLVGALFRLDAMQARADPGHGEAVMGALEDELASWMRCYADDASTEERYRLEPVAGIEAGPPDFAAGLVPPQRGPRGRNRLTPEQTATNQRDRILHAIAEVSLRKGYGETTVAAVVAEAGLAREVFYQHYRDKEAAYLAAYDLGFQTLVGQCAAAFFTSEEWPERVWQALRVFIDFMVNFPAFAHLGMVEAYAIGPQATSRMKERVTGFTIFLEEGYRQGARAGGLPALTSQAIAAAIFELVYETLRQRREHELPGLLPLIGFVTLTPFLGVDRTDEFIQGKVAAIGACDDPASAER
jgi:AcrR family transcriptional regulator